MRHGAVITGIAGAVAVAVLLPGIFHMIASVAQVTDAIEVSISLTGVAVIRTVVALVANAVTVSIRLRVGDEAAAPVAEVADSVTVQVSLVVVGGVWTVVAGVAYAITVPVVLPCVRQPGAVVTAVADVVHVRVDLGRIVDVRTVVATWHEFTATITIGITERWAASEDLGARITGVGEAVAVAVSDVVSTITSFDLDAEKQPIAAAISVAVVGERIRTWIASIAHPIPVAITVARIMKSEAGVTYVIDTVPVGVVAAVEDTGTSIEGWGNAIAVPVGRTPSSKADLPARFAFIVSVARSGTVATTAEGAQREQDYRGYRQGLVHGVCPSPSLASCSRSGASSDQRVRAPAPVPMASTVLIAAVDVMRSAQEPKEIRLVAEMSWLA